MYKNFRHQFEKENVTNAVFVLDLSCSIQDTEYVLPMLYPGNDLVDWAFFNLFQSKSQKHSDKGNCTYMANRLYNVLSNGVINITKPFGVGAWGTMNQTFGDPRDGYPSVPIPMNDRKLCLQQMKDFFSKNGTTRPQMKAAIYFNSLNSMISPYKNSTYGSLSLAPALESLLSLPVFAVND